MRENRDYLEMTFQSINCFADGALCIDDLNKIVDIALKDGIVDANEKRVLANIIGRLNEIELQGDLHERVNQLRTELKI